MKDFSDEDVMAYADGELPVERAERLRSALAADVRLRERLAVFEQSRQLLRRAFDTRRGEAVPERLLAVFGRGRRRTGRSRYAMLALAASLVLGVGLFLLRGTGPTVLPDAAFLGVALESTPSGVGIASAGSGGDEIVPLRTVRLADRSWCREFSFAHRSGGHVRTLKALGCRTGAAQWAVRALLPAAGTARDGQFRPAGAHDALDDLGPFEAVASDRETALIASHWN